MEDMELLELRARYEVLMEMPIDLGTEFGIATWHSRCDALREDVKRKGFEYSEVART